MGEGLYGKKSGIGGQREELGADRKMRIQEPGRIQRFDL